MYYISILNPTYRTKEKVYVGAFNTISHAPTAYGLSASAHYLELLPVKLKFHLCTQLWPTHPIDLLARINIHIFGSMLWTSGIYVMRCLEFWKEINGNYG